MELKGRDCGQLGDGTRYRGPAVPAPFSAVGVEPEGTGTPLEAISPLLLTVGLFLMRGKAIGGWRARGSYQC